MISGWILLHWPVSGYKYQAESARERREEDAVEHGGDVSDFPSANLFIELLWNVIVWYGPCFISNSNWAFYFMERFDLLQPYSKNQWIWVLVGSNPVTVG